MDGKRIPYGSPTASPAADLNQIPGQLILDRIEVLTGGASAVYGSDALAGVVNFIMKKDYEGLRLDAQYGICIATSTMTMWTAISTTRSASVASPTRHSSVCQSAA
ncbi:MAG: TonB-dependent receptor plug domain-containing protein [Alphaproteobacteria bacterium]